MNKITEEQFMFNWLPLLHNVNLNENDFKQDVKALLQVEREKCAKIVEKHQMPNSKFFKGNVLASTIIKAIRED